MAIKHLGNAVFVDTDPVEAPDGVEVDPDVHIYAYAKFRSLEHVSFGLFRTDGGPEDKETDSEAVGQYGMEPISQYLEFSDALDMIRHRDSFEEFPMVEVTSEKQYKEVLQASDLDPDSSAWEMPGLYDFRDDPPSFYGSVEENELSNMERAADDAIDFMFQGEEWEDAYRTLAEDSEEG